MSCHCQQCQLNTWLHVWVYFLCFVWIDLSGAMYNAFLFANFCFWTWMNGAGAVESLSPEYSPAADISRSTSSSTCSCAWEMSLSLMGFSRVPSNRESSRSGSKNCSSANSNTTVLPEPDTSHSIEMERDARRISEWGRSYILLSIVYCVNVFDSDLWALRRWD